MNNSKQIAAAEKRKTKSKSIEVKFFDNGIEHFITYDNGKPKYVVHLTSGGQYDRCSCLSWWYGMDFVYDGKFCFESNYFAEHGYAFVCKHILAAREKQ